MPQFRFTNPPGPTDPAIDERFCPPARLDGDHRYFLAEREAYERLQRVPDTRVPKCYGTVTISPSLEKKLREEWGFRYLPQQHPRRRKAGGVMPLMGLWMEYITGQRLGKDKLRVFGSEEREGIERSVVKGVEGMHEVGVL